MNTTVKKILISLLSMLASMLILPILILKFAPADSGMALCFLLFFVIDPFVVIANGVAAGTELKRLWWIPTVCAVAFAILFSIAVGELVSDLFIYSAIFLCAGVLSMLGTHFGMKYAKRYLSSRPDDQQTEKEKDTL